MAFHLPWVFLFGLLGNIISLLVCLAPMPTFYQICKKKTSEGFQSIPYVIALFSAMLWLFYAVFAEDATLLITINSFTFFMEVIYITLYLFYAIKKDRILTTKLILLFNVFGFGTICLLALFLTKGEKRVHVLGWICMIFSLCVFAAPLGIVVPNILGFIFGVLQMVLYMIYRNPKNGLDEKPKLHELSDQHIIEVATILSKLDSSVVTVEKKEDIQDQDSKKQNQKIKNQEKNNVFDTV
ncbi:bidirectional sugar transporter SWEET10 isoform X2 [Jatropha curcas]|uniref:bidirectional sugar transporter SWEET10 isoform X2 n=1 Tax=Jatropha curcas TaxID=180498 RepID=UPI0018955C6C|nr:bidirectional sugar transporter SWEET10 isoform X2 [Jatropha curcas]